MKHAFARLAICLLTLVGVSCSSAHKTVPSSAPNTASFSLHHSEWLLADLAGTAVVPNSRASLAFLDSGKVAGSASCNRFTGTVSISGNTLKFSPLATTMMACVDPKLGAQETTYLKALGRASRYEWQAPYLMIYCDGFDKPLRFTRAASPSN
jgi:heat shock protein HslJ